MRVSRPLFLALSLLLAAAPAVAEVTRVEITSETPWAGGRSFGDVGPYVEIKGIVHFEVDPEVGANARVVDLRLAPRNERGRVEFSADLEIIAPRDLDHASGLLLYGVNNRGGPRPATFFNRGSSDFLMRRGIVLVAHGWIAELLPTPSKLRMHVPVASDRGRPVTGHVRLEMAPSAPATRLNATHVSWSGGGNSFGGHGNHEPTKLGLAHATLTVRLKEKDERVAIPRGKWRVETKWPTGAPKGTSLPSVEVVLEEGFKAGHLYELIYEAKNPLVQGLGFAGMRDLVSFLRHDGSEENPLRRANGRSAVDRTVGFGVSQSGRCLRMFLYDGFNADEDGRRVFDGLIPHVAGAGMGFFNHRFASPTRHNTQHDNHDYPADVFPFTYGDEEDPFTGRVDGLLRRARETNTVPKIMHPQSSAEYWHRSGSLVHTDPLGRRDAVIPEEVRVYAIGGSQHGPGSGRPRDATSGQLRRNPTDYMPAMRALLVAMDRWISDGTPPPPSRYPKIADGTLVSWIEAKSGWRAIPGVKYPTVIQQPEHLDYGPEYDTKRIITHHPPVSKGDYRVLVPACGPDNNEKGTLLLPGVSVPVATFTGWNLRAERLGAPTELLSLAGGYIPFARTAKERGAAGDPRPALLERYRDYEDYLSQYRAAARRLIEEGYALEEDFGAIMRVAEWSRPLFE